MFSREVVFTAALALCPATLALAGNIDPAGQQAQYVYGENVGWLNFQPSQGDGTTVGDSALSGYIWGQNIGWINLSPAFGGVVNDGTGLLSGYAWGENVGWINFNPKVPGDPTHYGVTIDTEGNFAGWAWGQNVGWIHFQGTGAVAYGMKTGWRTSCVVDFKHLGKLAELWLQEAGPADLDGNGTVDFEDYAELADIWHQLCPTGFPIHALVER